MLSTAMNVFPSPSSGLDSRSQVPRGIRNCGRHHDSGPFPIEPAMPPIRELLSADPLTLARFPAALAVGQIPWILHAPGAPTTRGGHALFVRDEPAVRGTAVGIIILSAPRPMTSACDGRGAIAASEPTATRANADRMSINPRSSPGS